MGDANEGVASVKAPPSTESESTNRDTGSSKGSSITTTPHAVAVSSVAGDATHMTDNTETEMEAETEKEKGAETATAAGDAAPMVTTVTEQAAPEPVEDQGGKWVTIPADDEAQQPVPKAATVPGRPLGMRAVTTCKLLTKKERMVRRLQRVAARPPGVYRPHSRKYQHLYRHGHYLDMSTKSSTIRYNGTGPFPWHPRKPVENNWCNVSATAACEKLAKESVDFQAKRFQKRKSNKNSSVVSWDSAVRERLASRSIFLMSRADSRFVYHGADHGSFKVALIVALDRDGLVFSSTADPDKGMKLKYGETAFDLLTEIDKGHLPYALSSLLPEMHTTQFYEGALVVELRDRRLGTNHVLTRVVLRSTPTSVLSDMHEMLAQKPPAVTSTSGKSTNVKNSKSVGVETGRALWTAETVQHLEANIVLSRRRALCLDPSPMVFCVNNRIQYNHRKFNARAMGLQRRKQLRKWLDSVGVDMASPADDLTERVNGQLPKKDTDTPSLQSFLLRQRQFKREDKQKAARKWFDPLTCLTGPPPQYNLGAYPVKTSLEVTPSTKVNAYAARTVKCESRQQIKPRAEAQGPQSVPGSKVPLPGKQNGSDQQQQTEQHRQQQYSSPQEQINNNNNNNSNTQQQQQSTLSTMTAVEMKPSATGIYEGVLKHLVRGQGVGTIGTPAAIPFSLGLQDAAEATMKQFRRMFVVEKNRIIADEKALLVPSQLR